MIWILLYIIPIILIAINIWMDMEKGQTVSEYFDAEKGVFSDELLSTLIIVFIPAINLFTLFLTVPLLVFNLVKNIRK